MTSKDIKSPFDFWASQPWMKDATAFWEKYLSETRSLNNTEGLDKLRQMQADMMAFVDQRITKDLDVMRKFAEAKTPADAGKVQLTYLQDLMNDYNAQAIKVADEASKAMSAAVAKMPKGL